MPRRPRPSERSVEAALVRGIEAFGGMCPKGELFAGFPDRVVLLPGAVFLLVETKTEGGKLSAIQRRVHAALRALGFRVEVSSSRADVERLLAGLGREVHP